MKTLLVFCLCIHSFSGLAATKKPEKTLEIKAHIVKMLLAEDKKYRLELREYAAVYHAEEKFSSCLQKAIQEGKQATLVVSAYSLNVQKCNL